MRGSSHRRLAAWIALAGFALLGVALLLAALRLRDAEERAAPGALPPGGPAVEGAPVPVELMGPVSDEEVPSAEEERPADSTPDAAAAEPMVHAPAQRVPVAVGMQGRVVDAETGAPLAGVVIERSFAGSVEHRAKSGPDGAFAFAPSVRASGRLEASKPGWRFKPSSVRLKQREPGRAIVFQGTPIAAALVHGRLVEVDTGEPVPRYRFALSGRGIASEQLVTDEEGRFASRSAFEEGEVVILLGESDLWDTSVIEHRVADGEAEAQDVAIRVGPTLFFELEGVLESDVVGMTAELIDRGAPITRGWWRAAAQGWGGWLDDVDLPSDASLHGHRSGIEAEVRLDGGTVWARLPTLDEEDLRPGPSGHAVLVSDRERGLGGVGFVGALSGIQREPIKIRMEPILTVSGSVSTVEGDPIPRAFVTLAGSRLASGLACMTDHDGDFAFWAPPGAYDLTVESLHGALERSVALAGQDVDLELELNTVKTMEVAGSFHIPSGAFVGEPSFELRSISDPSLRFPADIKRKEVLGFTLLQSDGSLTGTFRFDRVPAGSYELLAPGRAGFAWEPSRTPVDRSVTDLMLVYRDDAPSTTLRFDVRAPDGHAPQSEVAVWIQGEPARVAWTEGDIDVATGSTVHWVVLAEAFIPRQGACRIDTPKEQTLAIRVEPGAGLCLMTCDPWGAGVAGAEILIDGVAAGRTNDFGFATFALHDAARTVEGRRPGWVCVDSVVDLEEGYAVLCMAPED